MNPLKVKASATPITSANFSGLQPMTDAEVKNYIANIITEKFAADTDGTGTAELNIDTANLLSGTSIGNFVDTKRTEAIGTHPATGATTSTTYYAKQVTSAAAESITNRPIKWDNNTKELDDTDVDGVMDLVIEAMVSESTYTAGQYKLQATVPSGGTWVARYTITDEAAGGNTTTYLWQKTVATSSADSDLTPLKSNNVNSIKQMSVAEIEQMVPNFRNRIIDTSIGTYKFQSATPGTGTWVQMGDTLSDTRQSIAELTYVSGAGYSGAYTNTFTNEYTGDFATAYTTGYTGGYSVGYTGVYNSTYSGEYAGQFTGAYSRQYSGQFTGQYTGAYTKAYTGGYTSPAISYSGSYSSLVSSSYGGTYARSYTGSYATSYTKGYTGFYATSYTKGYTGFYATSYTKQYTGQYNRQYTDAFVITSIGYMSGIPPVPFISAVQYTKQYTGQYNRQYTKQYTATYQTSYTKQYTASYQTSYTKQYTGAYTKNYTGLYTSISGSTYIGSYAGAGSTYIGSFDSAYSGEYNTQYTNEFAQVYSGVYAASFGIIPSYSAEYTAAYSGAYTNTYDGSFTGSYGVGASYSGDTIQATKDTVATIKLWIRTA